MSIDLKIERFGAELVNQLFTNRHLEGFVPHSLDAYSGVESELNDDIVKAVKVHLTFFGSYYESFHQDFYDEFRRNQMDFLIFAMETFPHQPLGEDVKEVMSKFLSSCAFLMAVGYSKFLGKIHLIWAMFVDLQLKDEFYKAGGWPELRKHAWIYCEPVYRFMERFNEVGDCGRNNLLHRTALTIQSLFAMCHFYDDPLVVESDLPMGLQWVDFVVKSPSMPARLGTEDIEDLEVLLRLLKDLMDPFARRETAYGEFIPAVMSMGMEERACMDVLASGNFGKYPEFKEVMEKLCEFVEPVLKVPGSVLSGKWRNSEVESTDGAVDEPKDHLTKSDELESGDCDISSKTASKGLPGRGLPGGGERMAHTPLLPAVSLLKENERSTSLEFPIRENKELTLQKPILEKQSTETGERSEVDESSCKHSIYKGLMESLQRTYPHLIKAISVTEFSGSGQGSSITLSQVFSVLQNSYNKPLKVVVLNGMKTELKSECSSGLSSSPKRGKRSQIRELYSQT